MQSLDNPVYVEWPAGIGRGDQSHIMSSTDAVLLVTSALALARGRLEILLADFALVYIMEK